MRYSRIHSFMAGRLIAMFGLTSTVGWVCLLFSLIVEQKTAAEFILKPSGIEQVGLTIYILGVATVVFVIIYCTFRS